jgi:hypothetical protein
MSTQWGSSSDLRLRKKATRHNTEHPDLGQPAVARWLHVRTDITLEAWFNRRRQCQSWGESCHALEHVINRCIGVARRLRDPYDQ